MCLIAFAWQPGQAIPLRLIGNRDEFYARPTAALARWQDKPEVIGGRDLEAGGTWLAARPGIVAALTNVRDPSLPIPSKAPSRGALVTQALESDDIERWLEALAQGGAARYAGFNLLVATPTMLWHLHRGREQIALNQIAPGVHGLSNADLNTPWPKLLKAREALAAAEKFWPARPIDTLLDTRQAPDDQLPDTGIGVAWERFLSPPFIQGEKYGTRATTWVTLARNGAVEMNERRFGRHGKPLGETALSLS